MIGLRLPLTCALAVCACSRGHVESAPTAPESRTAFGTASGVTHAAGSAESHAFRVIPLAPMSGDVEMLLGHPDSAGRPFVMRIRELPGTIVPPHTHPVDEHITVVSGTWYFGTGERFDSTALRELSTGAYAFAPAGTTMFAYSPEGAVVQVHGTGPFHITWRHGSTTLDEPGAERVFRFRRGDVVLTPRGEGRIRQGYASGSIVQYEIEGAGGALFMASQDQVRLR
jgi:quercetin dioxygenase-like cupin family protein